MRNGEWGMGNGFRGTFVLILLAVEAASAPAQVMQREAPRPLDSLEQRQRDAFLALRDSLTAVRAAMGEMQRDLASVSGAVVEGRARRLADRCQRARTTAMAARGSVCPRCGTPGHGDARRAATAALEQLARVLVRCGTELGAATPPDTVRAWAPHWVARLNDDLRSYERAAYQYLGSVDI